MAEIKLKQDAEYIKRMKVLRREEQRLAKKKHGFFSFLKKQDSKVLVPKRSELSLSAMLDPSILTNDEMNEIIDAVGFEESTTKQTTHNNNNESVRSQSSSSAKAPPDYVRVSLRLTLGLGSVLLMRSPSKPLANLVFEGLTLCLTLRPSWRTVCRFPRSFVFHREFVSSYP